MKLAIRKEPEACASLASKGALEEEEEEEEKEEEEPEGWMHEESGFLSNLTPSLSKVMTTSV
jgi:hypothetical protein